MKNKLHAIIFALLMALNFSIFNAQITQTSIVEHFTNTSCSVCANNNNGFYSIINNYPNTLHISFHPSAPYSNDVFNQQNQAENDGRTNFYGIFGSTPRLIVNGTAISNQTLNNTLSAAVNSMTNFEIQVTQEQVSDNGFNVQVVVKKIADDNQSEALLFVGVSEDTIYQNTNNGETVHYNVFRKALSPAGGISFTLPVNIGDSIITNYSYQTPSNWNVNRLHTLALIQNTNKTVINAAKSINSISTSAGILAQESNAFIVYPNPTISNSFFINISINELQVLNLSGHLVKSIDSALANELIDVSDIKPGIYFIRFKSDNEFYHHKIVID